MPQTKTYDAVPQVLRDTPRWLLWKAVSKGEGKKPTKVPVTVHGFNASTTERSNWSSYDAVIAAYNPKVHAGIGFVFDGSDGLTGIDLDNCFDDCGIQNNVAHSFLAVPGYKEFSPSGNGIHIITRTEYINSPGTNHKIGLEIYTNGRYFTFTGKQIGTDTIPDTPIEFDGLVDRYLSKGTAEFARTAPDENAFASWKATISDYPLERVKAEILSKLDPSMSEPDWFKVGAALHHQGQGEVEWLDAFDEWSSKGDNYSGYEACAERWQRYNLTRFKGNVTTLASFIGKKEAPFDPAQALAGWYSASDLAGMLQPPQFVIDGLLEAESKLLIWGKPSAKKSFFAIEMAVCVAAGIPFFGRRIKTPGPVVFIAGEGAGGLARRFEACCRKHGLDLKTLPIYFNRTNKDLMAPVIVQDLNTLGDQIKKDHGSFPRIVFFDTYNTSSSADENKAEDFALILGHLRDITTYQGAVPGIVHHAGKDGKTYRGSSAMGAGMDTEIHMEAQEGSDITTVTNPKQKEGPTFAPFTLESEEVILGKDDEGEFYGSLVLKLSDQPVPVAPKRKEDAPVGRWQVEVKSQLNEEPRTFEELVACVPLDFTNYRNRTSEMRKAVNRMLELKEIWVDDDGKYALENGV